MSQLNRPVFLKQQFRAHHRHHISPETRDALLKNPRERTEEDVELLVGATTGLKSFDKLSDYVHREICKVMYYEAFNTNTTVFEQGEVGHSFYFILHGTVAVNVRETGSCASLTVCTLPAGESFGELGLVHNQPRAATIVTRDRCELLRVEKEDYHRILKWTHEKELSDKVEFLRNISIFRTWAPSSLSSLSDILAIKKYMPNKVVIKQDDEPDGLFFLKRGECKVCVCVTVGPPSDRQKKVLQIGTLGPGDYFGEVALLDNCPRSASVITSTKVEVFLLNKLDFRSRVTGKSLEYMRLYADKYPTEKEVRQAYYDQRKWVAYKKSLVGDIVSAKKARQPFR